MAKRSFQLIDKNRQKFHTHCQLLRYCYCLKFWIELILLWKIINDAYLRLLLNVSLNASWLEYLKSLFTSENMFTNSLKTFSRCYLNSKSNTTMLWYICQILSYHFTLKRSISTFKTFRWMISIFCHAIISMYSDNKV